MTAQHTPGPWFVSKSNPLSVIESGPRGNQIAKMGAALGVCSKEQAEANARLIAAAPTQHAEMIRYLPVLERAESDPELWARLTEGLGIATLNSYRHAIVKATGGEV